MQIQAFPKTIIILIVVFTLQQNSGFAFAQEADQPAEPVLDNNTEIQITEEVQQSVEAELEVSPEVIQELTINLNEELGLGDYDPIVKTDGLMGKIIQPIKEVAWNTEEGLYNTFASDASYAKLVKTHADKELVAAAKIYSKNPGESHAVVNMLENYRDDVDAAKDAIEQVKKEDPDLAKSIAEDIAADHMFVAPKVLGSMEDGFLQTAPEEVPRLLEVKKNVLAAAGEAVVNGTDDQADAASVLKTLAEEKRVTSFSGIALAEFLSQAKDGLPDDLADSIGSVFDDVINTQIKSVEDNLKNLSGTDEAKTESFGKYVSQLPGHGLDRLKIMDQFKSQTNLPPAMIEKMQEVKAKIAQTIGEKIKNLAQEEIRKAVSDAMFDFKKTDLHSLKMLTEMEDIIPNEEIKQVISRKHEEKIQEFRAAFADDSNAQRVTDEFEGLMKKVQNGEVPPDANLFKTLDSLKSQLPPDQQEFIKNMEQTSRQEMLDRIQNDQYFAERFATFNPADIEIYKKVGKEAPEPTENNNGNQKNFGQPRFNFNFEDKFKQIEQQQAQNFGRYLDLQSRPEDVQAIRQNFETAVPEEVRQKFETQYNFNADTFSKQEDQTRQKEEFFRQKFEQVEKDYQEKFGGQDGQPGGTGANRFPGSGQFRFPGGSGFSPSFFGQSGFSDGGQVQPIPGTKPDTNLNPNQESQTIPGMPGRADQMRQFQVQPVQPGSGIEQNPGMMDSVPSQEFRQPIQNMPFNPGSSSGFGEPMNTFPTPTRQFSPEQMMPPPTNSFPSGGFSPTAPTGPEPAPMQSAPPSPSGYLPAGDVAGIFTRTSPVDFGISDWLLFFGLGLYGYLRREKPKSRKKPKK